MEQARTAQERLLTPTKVTAWLDCEHYLTLKHAVEAGQLPRPSFGASSFAKLLMDKGMQHERACLDDLRQGGRRITEVAKGARGEAFGDWVDREATHLSSDADVLYQLPLAHDGIRGIADFLLRSTTSDGLTTWEPVDAKLARTDAKPGHVLQLCFYAEAIEAATEVLPEQVHVWLGSGRMESVRTVEVLPYWRRLRSQLRVLLEQPTEAPAETSPTPCSHCEFCEFAGHCESEWREADALHFVAGIRQRDRQHLELGEVSTTTDLSTCDGPVQGLADERLAVLRTQAELQVAAHEGEPPPFELVPEADTPPWGHGFAQLPEPSNGDVHLDFEGHPFWRADTGLLFLFGLLLRDDDGEWTYVARWAHTEAEEAEAARWLVDFLIERRDEHPGMHVLHYNHTERTALQALFIKHDLPEARLDSLVDEGTFVDLYPVVRNSVQVGVESYGLKHLEALTGYERGHEIDRGAGAVVAYEDFMSRVPEAQRSGLTDDQARELANIAAYNADDVWSTKSLHEWLLDHRPAELPWRPAVLDPDDALPELDERVEALQQFPPGSPEHLLGDLCGYWQREGRAFRAQRLAKLDTTEDRLLEDPDIVAGVEVGEWFSEIGARGQPLKPKLPLTFPTEQELSDALADFGPAPSLMFVDEDGATRYLNVVDRDPDAGLVTVRFDPEKVSVDQIPGALALNDAVRQTPKPTALAELADEVIDAGGVHAVTSAARAVLTSEAPRFKSGQEPTGGRFVDDHDEMERCVLGLDNSVLAIQGPPGTGKTWRAARIIRRLLREGRRVGITAQAHAAIDNLVEAVVKALAESGESDLLRGLKHGGPTSITELAGMERAKKPADAGQGTYNLVAGTSWLFANADVRANPVDVLVVDEAGQLSLVDTVVAAMAAENVLLLGDPQQLAHVSIASHPGGSGVSALEHVLQGRDTIAEDRGFFLAETWRMHPNVCEFISDVIYEGRLGSRPHCADQTTVEGTGLRWLRVEHNECSTSSPVEVELIAAQIERLLGTLWTDGEGVTRPIDPEDLMVVAPYNDQVNLLKERLRSRPVTADIPVGTVDKFQGREAAVVFFSMTTSSAEDMPRGPEFLFSRNRLNVAISRARCLAYLVCTEDLLNSRARTLEDMRLISTLCAFVERTR